VDVIWLRDPRALLLDRALGAADVMVATDCLSPTDDDDKTPRPKGANRCAYGPANVHGHAAFNTGVLFFRATAAARVAAAASTGAASYAVAQSQRPALLPRAAAASASPRENSKLSSPTTSTLGTAVNRAT
jgi:hypothetical protein